MYIKIKLLKFYIKIKHNNLRNQNFLMDNSNTKLKYIYVYLISFFFLKQNLREITKLLYLVVKHCKA